MIAVTIVLRARMVPSPRPSMPGESNVSGRAIAAPSEDPGVRDGVADSNLALEGGGIPSPRLSWLLSSTALLYFLE